MKCWVWLIVLLLIFAFMYESRDGFKVQLEADASDLGKVHQSVKKWTSDFIRQGRAFAWDIIPLKHVYRRWRRKI